MPSSYLISNLTTARDAVAALWMREAGLSADEAQRRLDEVLLVATDADGAVAGVSTAYLARSDQLRLDVWHMRVFVARAHRRGEIARRLLREGFDALRGREGAGALLEVENAAVRHAEIDAIWPTTRFAFIGENARGAHVRVRYFPQPRRTLARLDATTEIVRGHVDEWSERLLAFWTGNGVLSEAQGRERLPQVVAVLLDADGEIAGVSSVYEADVPLIGNRRFWIYRNFLLPRAADGWPQLVGATFDALQAGFDPAGPIGLCLALTPDEAARRPEAVWDDPPMLYAGYLADGRQVRIGYFQGATVVRG